MLHLVLVVKLASSYMLRLVELVYYYMLRPVELVEVVNAAASTAGAAASSTL